MTKLLIVDDEEHLVESMLQTIPWSTIGVTSVAGAQSASEALQHLRNEGADIVITDVRMPEMDGLELIRAIHSEWEHIKCILLSGYAEFEYVKEGMRNNASNYLLKPVRDEELLTCVHEVMLAQALELEKKREYLRSSSLLHQNFPLLRSNLLNELIQGKHWHEHKLENRLELLSIPIQSGDRLSMLLIRPEDVDGIYSLKDMPHLGFAVANVAEELLSESFDCWYCEDLFNNLLFMVKPKAERSLEKSLEETADKIRIIIKQLLKLTVSIIISKRFLFPEEIQTYYQKSMASIIQQVGSDQDFVVQLGDDKTLIGPSSRSLNSLYTPPLFAHLLEAGQWKAAKDKLKEIFQEWEERYHGSREHLTEIYLALSSAFSYFIHKNGKWISHYQLELGIQFKGAHELNLWATELLQRIEDEMQSDMLQYRSSMVNQIRQYVQEHLSEDVSLQALADFVHLHPTHLSKVYKNETGENITDYLLRLRMEKAVYYLKYTNEKVYEIAGKLGYKNPAYFIKVFKSQFGVTPHEFRD